MKYIAHLLTDNEYLQHTEAYSKKYFITKNRDLVDLHQKGVVIKSKDFDSIWSELKEVIWRKQGMRCCICETDFTITHSTDVEHYRPKVQYWWLAYNYENYYLACAECNRKYKRVEFPLFDENKRVNYRLRKNIKTEQPLLINPLFDNPLDYFKIHFKTSSNSNKNIIALLPKEKTSNRNNYSYQKAQKSIDIYNLDLSKYSFTRHEILRKFFNKLIKVAVYRYVFRNDNSKFKEFYRDFISDEDRKELHSLGLMKMVLKGQFVITPYILNDYKRQYKLK